MNLGFVRTIHGLLNLIQVALGFAALFASSFIWKDTNLYFQFIYKYFGWQSVVLAILFITWIIAVAIFFARLFDRDVEESVGKFRLIILYILCLIALVVSASLESWYIGRASATGKHPDGTYHPRFVAVTVFNWMLVASYIVLIPVTFFC